jgi:hypothetical protein
MWSARTFATLAIIAVAMVQIWIVSAGRMIDWPTSTNYYSLLADAFLHGQTSLRQAPSPELLALPDPYDPAQNESFRLHDMSLYRGKYYLYWGPVPAILESPIVLMFHRAIGDQYLVFCFVFGIVLISAEILLDLRKRIFADAPPWTVAMGILVAGLAAPMPILLERPAVYEAAIAAGQFFLLAGMFCAIKAFAAGCPRPAPLLAAGVCWALALGSRASLAAAIGALTLSVAWRACTSSPRSGRLRSGTISMMLSALGIPVFLGVASLARYNYARFGSWRESGVGFQLAGFNQHQLQNQLFTLANFPPALYAYLVHPLMISGTFPFLRAVGISHSIPSFIKVPPNYFASAAIVGMPWCVPFLCFAVIPFHFWVRRLFRSRAVGASGRQGKCQHAETEWTFLWLGMGSLLGLLPLLFLIGCSVRYFADFTPSMVILAMMGLWLARAEQAPARRWLTVQACTLAVYSILIGILLAIAVTANDLGFP